MDEPDDPITRTPEEARQGQMVLRRRWQRIVFLGGLALFVLIVVALRLR